MLQNFQRMDPFLLLSIINTKLRDFHPSLEDLARTYDIDSEQLTEKLQQIGYHYHAQVNQFKQR